MSTWQKKIVIGLVIFLILLNYGSANVKLVLSSPGGKIDLFTQKDPSGEGSNMPSDAFAPGENVTIHALVTYNDYPMTGILVSFSVRGPENSIQNITQFRVSQTNNLGVASINIRLGWISECFFGEWSIVGNARISDSIALQDTLSFRVGWIVNITSIITVNENLIEQERFTRDSQMGVKLVLQNIGLTEKNVTIMLTMHDELNTPLKSVEICGLVLASSGILVYTHFLIVPKEAVIGEATIYASVYTTTFDQGGIPFCPEASASFFITIRDIAILSVDVDPTSVYKGNTVKIDVTVKNKGLETESFALSIYYNETVIDTFSVINLLSDSSKTISFIWNTSNVKEGNYRISAYAEPVSEETEIKNNQLINGFIKVIAWEHDVAVIDVKPSSQNVNQGDTLYINITIKNQGTYNESFNIIVYYDNNVAGVISVEFLKPNSTRKFVFHWKTDKVSIGNYTLSALAEPLQDEDKTANNYFIDGVVEVKPASVALLIPFWFWWFLLILFILIALFAIWLQRRKKRKKEEESFYSGWTAWYYSYNLRDKT